MADVAAKGGHARAEKLSPDERKAIAKKAAEKRWGVKPLRATHTGVLQLGGMECAVLEDERRVVSERGMLRSLGRAAAGGQTYRRRAADSAAGHLPIYLAPANLRPFISDDLLSPTARQIPYYVATDRGAPVALGIDARLIPQICEVWLKARAERALRKAQLPTAEKAEILMRGLALVGIVALVDEATGYDVVRDKLALQAILDKFLRKELAAWAKRFPDEFYQGIFRLRGWEWKGMKVNRPQAVAQYTKNLVYARLAPGILRELEERREQTTAKHAKMHQWLTDDVGHPALAQHLHSLIGFMRVAKGWEHFVNMVDVAWPKRGDTLKMAFMVE